MHSTWSSLSKTKESRNCPCLQAEAKSRKRATFNNGQKWASFKNMHFSGGHRPTLRPQGNNNKRDRLGGQGFPAAGRTFMQYFADVFAKEATTASDHNNNNIYKKQQHSTTTTTIILVGGQTVRTRKLPHYQKTGYFPLWWGMLG